MYAAERQGAQKTDTLLTSMSESQGATIKLSVSLPNAINVLSLSSKVATKYH